MSARAASRGMPGRDEQRDYMPRAEDSESQPSDSANSDRAGNPVNVEQRPADLDAELMMLLIAEPLTGLARIYDQYSSLVYGLARAILTNAHEAEDLTQEIFMGLLGRCAYDPARGSLASFLTTVTRSRAIDILRSRNRSVRLLGTWGDGSTSQRSEPATPLDEVSTGECAQSVQLALASLPASQRQVLELAYFKGLTQTEIAEALNAPLGTVKTWARKGLYSLRSALQNFAD